MRSPDRRAVKSSSISRIPPSLLPVFCCCGFDPDISARCATTPVCPNKFGDGANSKGDPDEYFGNLDDGGAMSQGRPSPPSCATTGMVSILTGLHSWRQTARVSCARTAKLVGPVDPIGIPPLAPDQCAPARAAFRRARIFWILHVPDQCCACGALAGLCAAAAATTTHCQSYRRMPPPIIIRVRLTAHILLLAAPELVGATVVTVDYSDAAATPFEFEYGVDHGPVCTSACSRRSASGKCLANRP
eukprot:COSAG02_NODE_4696_length_5085_cov_2.504813_1_plen_245_part_10